MNFAVTSPEGIKTHSRDFYSRLKLYKKRLKKSYFERDFRAFFRLISFPR
jgi:hypothetical protein